MDPRTIPRATADAGVRDLIGRITAAERALTERAAMISQVTTTSGGTVVEPWQAGTAWADHAVMTLTVPVWATAMTLIGAGHVAPVFNTSAGSPYLYARIRVSAVLADGVQWDDWSEPFFSWMAAADVPAGLSWPFHVPGITPGSTVTIATQAYGTESATVSGGSVAVSGVAQWTR